MKNSLFAPSSSRPGPMFPERVPSIEALHEAPIRFRYTVPKVRRVLVDSLSARAILAVYDVINDENKAKLERMIQHSPERLHRVVSFAFQRVKIS